MRNSQPFCHTSQYEKLPTQSPFLPPTFLHGLFHLLTYLVFLRFLLPPSSHKAATSGDRGFLSRHSAQRPARFLTHTRQSFRSVEEMNEQGYWCHYEVTPKSSVLTSKGHADLTSQPLMFFLAQGSPHEMMQANHPTGSVQNGYCCYRRCLREERLLTNRDGSR